MPQDVALVIPCFNEERRLDVAALRHLIFGTPGLTLFLVDDGSTDGTFSVLEGLRRDNQRQVRVLRLPRNAGKAEAVRAGLRSALAEGAVLVGYFDADLSTPVGELQRLLAVAQASTAQVVLASRVRLLGTRIERQPHRHYLGRVFATLASLALQLPVYDTQCGTKLLRASRTLERALEAPFRTRWIFDVELLARLVHGGGEPPVLAEAMLEVPLEQWRDVGGSKLGAGSMLRAGFQLLRLLGRLRFGGSPW